MNDENEIKHNAKERHEELAAYADGHIKVNPYKDEFKAAVDATMREYGFPDQMKAIQFMIDTGQITADDPDRGGGVINLYEVRDNMQMKFNCTKKTAMKHIKRAEMRFHFPGIEFGQWGGVREGSGRPAIDPDEMDEIAEAAVAGI